jgi:hypothetical protein
MGINRVLLTRKWSPRTVRSSTSSSSEFSLHVNGPYGLLGRALHPHPSSPYTQVVPTDYSVEHFILIRVLLTRKWSPRTIRSSTSFSSEFSLRASGPHGLFGRALHSHPSSPFSLRASGPHGLFGQALHSHPSSPRASGPHGLFGRALHSHPSSPYA